MTDEQTAQATFTPPVRPVVDRLRGDLQRRGNLAHLGPVVQLPNCNMPAARVRVSRSRWFKDNCCKVRLSASFRSTTHFIRTPGRAIPKKISDPRQSRGLLGERLKGAITP